MKMMLGLSVAILMVIEARKYGVHSAMAAGRAKRLCPHAIVIKPRITYYAEVSRQIRDIFEQYTPLVEPLSIDEAFLDLSGTDRLHHATPALTLARFAKRVEDEIGITISVGLAPNKFLAKIASDLDKPRGFAALDQDEAREMLAERPYVQARGPPTCSWQTMPEGAPSEYSGASSRAPIPRGAR